MNVLNQPLTLAEIKKVKDEDNFVEGIVPVSLDNLIESNQEGFNDILSHRLVGDCGSMLTDIAYEVAGHEDKHTVLIKVTANASAILEDEEEE